MIHMRWLILSSSTTTNEGATSCGLQQQQLDAFPGPAVALDGPDRTVWSDISLYYKLVLRTRLPSRFI